MDRPISAEFPFESRYVEVEGSRGCRENLKDLTTIDSGPGIHYLQEDNPHLIGEELVQWYAGL